MELRINRVRINRFRPAPTFNQFGRKTKLNLNPDAVPDLKWKRSDILNTQTPIIPIKIEKVNTQTTVLTLK